MKNLKVLPYKVASESAKTLANGLGVKRLRLKGSKANFGRSSVTINWGNTDNGHDCYTGEGTVLNQPSAVKFAVNKATFLQGLSDESYIPRSTTEKKEARDMFAFCKKIVVREVLTGSAGKGITILDAVNFEHYDHSKAKLYVEYIPKKYEYRIHVVDGKVIDRRRKARKKDVSDEDVNWQVRNLENGFIYAIDPDFDFPKEADKVAIDCVAKAGLDFGAVDIVHNTTRGCSVLEINCAPGLEGTTVESYVKAFQEMAGNIKDGVSEPAFGAANGGGQFCG
jgi:glutathione synthase/RimK-type ligase-like ATP-grasp enzyme